MAFSRRKDKDSEKRSLLGRSSSRDPFEHLSEERAKAEEGEPWFLADDEAPELGLQAGISSNLSQEDLIDNLSQEDLIDPPALDRPGGFDQMEPNRAGPAGGPTFPAPASFTEDLPPAADVGPPDRTDGFGPELLPDDVSHHETPYPADPYGGPSHPDDAVAGPPHIDTPYPDPSYPEARHPDDHTPGPLDTPYPDVSPSDDPAASFPPPADPYGGPSHPDDADGGPPRFDTPYPDVSPSDDPAASFRPPADPLPAEPDIAPLDGVVDHPPEPFRPASSDMSPGPAPAAPAPETRPHEPIHDVAPEPAAFDDPASGSGEWEQTRPGPSVFDDPTPLPSADPVGPPQPGDPSVFPPTAPDAPADELGDLPGPQGRTAQQAPGPLERALVKTFRDVVAQAPTPPRANDEAGPAETGGVDAKGDTPETASPRPRTPVRPRKPVTKPRRF